MEQHYPVHYQGGLSHQYVDSGWLSDEVITNNGDKLKVLKTVAFCMMNALEIQSDASIYFMGNSPARNRLYKMYMNNYRSL